MTGDIKTVGTAETALDAIDTMIDTIAGNRADLGAASSNFSSAANNLQIMSESTSAARGRM